MADNTQPRNGNGTIAGNVRRLGQDLIGSLPPAFMLLLLINVVFIGIVFWHEHMAQVLRAEAINKLLDHCLK